MKELKTILITGGAGFIGSNLCEHFVSTGNRVICFDSFITGKKSNVEHLLAHPDFRLVEGDIRNMETCREITREVDVISHQAALGSVTRSIENPIPTNEINGQGFLNLLTAAKENQVRRFVYASSSSVYGDSTASPKKEEALGKPLSPYAVTKLTNELYGKVFHDLYGMETIGLRYFNVFGKNQDPNGAYAAAIPRFLNLLRNKQSPVIFGDGKQTRDFTYIRNVIIANELALFGTNPASFGQVYNVACGHSYSLLDVIDAIKAELVKTDPSAANVEPVFAPDRAGDIRNSLADIQKISEYLGYHPRYSFKDGINEYIKSTLTH